jgi:hypothetical protein
MRKLLVIIIACCLIAGCGKTTRLVKIEREVAEEQASLAAEAKADRSYFQIVKDIFYKHSYMYSALILTAAIGTASYLRYYHKPKHNFNKHMLALEYHPTPTDFIIPKQVADFLNQQPVNNPRQLLNHPGQPNNSVFSEPFIQYYEKTFKQKPTLMLTYGQKPETQVESLQNVNTNQHIDIQQQVAEYALMEANHIEPIIVEVPRVLGNAQAPIQTVVIPPQVATNFVRLLQILNPFNEPFIPQVPVDFSQTYVREARDPLLDEALFAIYGDARQPGSPYDKAIYNATNLYAFGWHHEDYPETYRVNWDRYPQAIWEIAIERWDQERLHGILRPPRPVYPWLPIEEKTRQEKAAEERLAAISSEERCCVNDAEGEYDWGWENVDAPIRVKWALYPQAIWEKAIARVDQRREQSRRYPPRPVPPWELTNDADRASK